MTSERLHTGATIGRYVLGRKLGEGGMGVVFDAEDQRLRRRVALKFLLPRAVTIDPDAKDRFLREAQAAACIDHPHICTVYEIDAIDGQIYIAMAMLEGKPLDRLIAERPLDLQLAVTIASQMVEALGAAHAHNIIHRDFKPANIIVAGHEGAALRAVLMDFGIARLADRTALTADHTTMGTLGYMSPEQTRSSKIDARADLWSLGVVLYEMVTGRRPFHAEAASGTIHAIQTATPEPVTALRSGVPMELERIVDKALAKDPDERYQSANDVLVDLRRVAKRSPAAPAAAATAAPAGSWQKHLVWLGTVAAAAMAAFWVSSAWHPVQSHTEPLRVAAPPPEGVTVAAHVALSPDGAQLAFAGDKQDGSRTLWIRSLTSENARELAHTEGARYPFWSPDGIHIGFFAHGWLRRIPAAGGPPERLAKAPNPVGGAWSAKGVIVYAARWAGGLVAIDASGGEPRAVTTLDDARWETAHLQPRFLPDGQRFLFVAETAERDSRVYMGSLEGDTPTEFSRDATNLATYSAARYVYERDGALFERAYDPATLQPFGDPVPLAESVAVNPAEAHASFSLSTSGSVAYLDRRRKTQLLRHGPTGAQLEMLAEGEFRAVELDPTGRRAALVDLDPKTGERRLWIFDLAAMSKTPFAAGAGEEFAPLWTPDGRSLLYSSGSESIWHIYRQRVGGTGEPEKVVESAEDKIAESLSPDGTTLVYSQRNPRTALDLYATPVDGSTAPTSLLSSEANEFDARVSPDGRWLAYVSDDTGAPEVYVTEFPESNTRTQISRGGGAQPRWRPSRAELLYVNHTGQLMAAAWSADAKVPADGPRPVFDGPALRRTDDDFAGSYYAVLPDGGGFLLVNPAPESRALPIHLVLR